MMMALNPVSQESNCVAANHARMTKPLEDWTEEDGEAVGGGLYDDVQVDKADREKLLGKVSAIFLGKYGALKKFSLDSPFVIPMLVTTLGFGAVKFGRRKRKRNRQKGKKEKEGRGRSGTNKAVAVAPLGEAQDDGAATSAGSEQERDAKAEKRGKELGLFFRISVLSHLQYKSGFAEWVVQNAEVDALVKEHPFFKGMMLAIAKKVAVESNTGMKYRLSVSVGLTYMDVSSDIYMMQQYWVQGRFVTFYTCLAIMIVHSFVQLVLCFVQNRKNKKYMAKEMALILMFIKPVIDLMRLIRSDPKQPHQTIDGLAEMMGSKQIEAVFEAFPQTLVQDVALISDLLRGEVNIGPIISIVISALTAAYTQAVIGYDVDVDPDEREKGGLI